MRRNNKVKVDEGEVTVEDEMVGVLVNGGNVKRKGRCVVVVSSSVGLDVDIIEGVDVGTTDGFNVDIIEGFNVGIIEGVVDVGVTVGFAVVVVGLLVIGAVDGTAVANWVGVAVSKVDCNTRTPAPLPTTSTFPSSLMPTALARNPPVRLTVPTLSHLLAAYRP